MAMRSYPSVRVTAPDVSYFATFFHSFIVTQGSCQNDGWCTNTEQTLYLLWKVWELCINDVLRFMILKTLELSPTIMLMRQKSFSFFHEEHKAIEIDAQNC